MKTARCSILALAAASTLAFVEPARALNILLTNDDGFESANIRALYAALKKEGHRVVISAPTQDQSGMGGSLSFAPISALKTATRYGSVQAGAAGMGADPTDVDIHYVAGTPVMSMLYGLEIVGPSAFGGKPDLIISGPNEGNNLGALAMSSSGTFANAFYGTNYGIPSIAVSGGDGTPRSFRTLTDGTDPAIRTADVVVQIVDTLARRADGGRLLPSGVGLNINVPKYTPICAPSHFALSHFGEGKLIIYLSLSAKINPLTKATDDGHPGLAIGRRGDVLPAGVIVPPDSQSDQEADVVASCRVSITPFVGQNDAALPDLRDIQQRLNPLLNPH